jgi:hypothetical protein
MLRPRPFFCLCLTLTLSLSLGRSLAAPPSATLAQQVASLVKQLDDQDADLRDQAEQQLLALAPIENARQCDDFLQQLSPPSDTLSTEMRLRLARLEKQIEARRASQSLVASRVTLAAEAMPLEELFAAIDAQTGNRLTDTRESPEEGGTPRTITIELRDEPFFAALEKVLDATQTRLYPFAEPGTLAITHRPTNDQTSHQRPCHTGPFRIEAASISARRNLRSSEPQQGVVELEIAWEPRLQPIALSQAIQSLDLRTDEGDPVEPTFRQPLLNVEIQPDDHWAELAIPFVLPSRSATQLASFKGVMSVLLPGRMVEFKFTDLATPTTQSSGGVTLQLRGTRLSQELLEVHMSIQVQDPEAGFGLHRGWVFQNRTYLLNAQGEILDHAGFETTMQSDTEISLAYLFDLPSDDLGQYTWVYHTPAALMRVPIVYELNNIPLP